MIPDYSGNRIKKKGIGGENVFFRPKVRKNTGIIRKIGLVIKKRL
jgi:hypothetical protein